MNREVDFNWLPLDGDCEYDDEYWAQFEDIVDDYDDEVEHNG